MIHMKTSIIIKDIEDMNTKYVLQWGQNQRRWTIYVLLTKGYILYLSAAMRKDLATWRCKPQQLLAKKKKKRNVSLNNIH